MLVVGMSHVDVFIGEVFVMQHDDDRVSVHHFDTVVEIFMGLKLCSICSHILPICAEAMEQILHNLYAVGWAGSTQLAR